MAQPRHIFSLFILALLSLMLVGCGDKDRGCKSDYDCEEELVCEPEGCRQVCLSDGDCLLGERCMARRVEEGLVCAMDRR